MKRAEQDRLDGLLARGRLSRPEKERMLEAVVAPPSWRVRWSSGWRSSLRFALPALAVLVLVPLVVLRPHDGFREKGVAGGAVLEASCAGGCRQGSTLVFRTGEVTTPGMLAAWADDGAGHRIWYFPTDGGELPAVGPHQAMETLPRGTRIGPEHASSSYTLSLVLLAPGPHSRDEALSASGIHTQTLEVAP